MMLYRTAISFITTTIIFKLTIQFKVFRYLMFFLRDHIVAFLIPSVN